MEKAREWEEGEGRSQKDRQLYPNTDMSIWLRTGSDVTDPLPGIVSFGLIPMWLSGCLIRNGPGGVNAYGDGSCKHAFDGPGLLQKFSLTNGSSTFSCRFIHSTSFKRNSVARRIVLGEFGTVATPDPCQSIFSRVATAFLGPLYSTISDNANISVHPFGDEIYSLAETPFAHRIHIDNLETLTTVDVHKDLGVINHSAHPHILGNTTYNIGQRLIGLWQGPHYIIAELGAKGPSSPTGEIGPYSPWSTAKIIATIPSRWPLSFCYMHSFSVTQSYFILIEQPLSIFIPSVPFHQIVADKPIASCLKFHPEEDTLFHVISRVSKKRKTFRAPCFFFLHTINAFEMRNGDSDETFIVIDICTYKDPSIIEGMYVDALKNAQSNADYANLFRSRPKRFLLKLNKSTELESSDFSEVESEMIVDVGCETPRINELFDGKPYNYFYAMSSEIDADKPGTLIKADVRSKTYETWNERNAYPSEPIFVPRPQSQREDDGIILSTLVYGGEDTNGPNRTSLIILDANSFSLLAKVDFNCESAVPKCLHGWFFPDKTVHRFQEEGNSSEESRSLSPTH